MKKILLAVLAVFVLLVAVLGIAVATFDINKHRGQIEAALTKETGHAVKLGGDLHIGLSLKGLTLSAEDVAFGNPPWASRPNLASIKKFDLNVGLFPLLSHQVDIKGLAIEDADILLESAASNRHNWDMKPAAAANTAPPEQATANATPTSPSQPVSINIGNLTIKNSVIAMRSEDGKTTVFKADDFTLGHENTGMGVHFDGSMNDLPVKLVVTTNGDPLTSKAARPVDVDLTFANYHVTAHGHVNPGKQQASFDTYELASGDTKISGKLDAAWDGARPAVQGSIASERINPADLQMAGAKNESAEPAKTTTPQQANALPHIFSDAPLPLAALKSADAHVDFAIGALPAGSVELQNIKGELVINNGHLFLSPLTMALGAGTIIGQINLDASKIPAQLSTSFTVNDVDLSDVIKAGGAEAFLSGKMKADINLTSSGNSLHDLASNLSGPVQLISAGGDVLSRASDALSAGLANILAPGTGNQNEGMNCMVARFIAHNGVLRGNGILIDTAAATAQGFGDIDLRSESLNLDFRTKTKLVNAGGLLPALHIGGTIANPSIGADANSVIQNVGQLLMNGGAVQDTVPDVVTQAGQNACAYALDHPSASAAPAANQGGVVQGLAGKAGSMLKGLFGK